MREPQRDTNQAAAQQPPSDPLASAVARSVSELRHSAGLSERAAARKLGTSQTQLRRMEDPRYLPSLRSLARLATVYGYELKIDFLPPEKGSRGGKGAAARPRDAAMQKSPRGGGKAAAARPKNGATRPASASGSPSKGRAGAPRRGRAAARGTGRRAAPRRRS